MGFRKTPFVSGEYYHIYNRGNSKQKIFLDESDYNRFLKLLFLCNSELNINFRNVIDVTKDIFVFEREKTLVDIGAFCLMPNHFHLLLREKEDGNISLFMASPRRVFKMSLTDGVSTSNLKPFCFVEILSEVSAQSIFWEECAGAKVLSSFI